MVNMKYLLSVCVILFCGLELALAAVAQGPLEEKPAEFKDQEGCYIKDVNQVIPVGKSAEPIGKCISVRCHADSLSYESCGSVSFNGPPNCHTVEDKKQPYPKCCPQIKCD